MWESWVASLLVLTVLSLQCAGNFNLYLDSQEVMRLLGLESTELYYVREGRVNRYASDYAVSIHAGLSHLHFTWQSLAGRPLPYVMRIDVADPIALGPAVLNVSRTGSVPTVPQVFRVSLACSGHRVTDVDVVIALNVTSGRAANVTRLLLRRRKACPPAPVVPVPLPPAPSSADVFYVAAGGALATAAAAALLAACCLARSTEPRTRPSSPARAEPREAFLATESGGGGGDSSCKSVGSGSRAAEERSEDLHVRIAELTIQRCRVRLRSVVQEGTFGRVYCGSYAEDGGEREVLVKTVSEHASHAQVSLLLQEGLALYGLRHRHVQGVLGVSIEDHTAPFLVYAHGGRSNLKRFLQACRGADGGARALTTRELVGMALQAARALHFLHGAGVVHRDVAARNCAVDERLRLQVADTALARDLFPGDYHCLGDNENRPVKWLAAEALQRRRFSAASDAWAFGVLLWELATLARQPYAEVDPSEMAAYLRDGYRLSQPVNCPDELFAVMAYCWAVTPEERPSFPQLQTFLQDFHAQLTRYV